MRAKRNKWRERKRVTLFAFAWTCTPFLLVKTPSVLAKSHRKKAQFCRFGKGKIQETKKLKSRGKFYKTFTRIICKCGHCFQTMATHVIYACKSLINWRPLAVWSPTHDSRRALAHTFRSEGGRGGGVGTPGNSWWGCAARFSKSWPYSRQKNVIFYTCFQTWPVKSIPVFTPGI